MFVEGFFCQNPGSTISTLLHDRINPKDCQVLSLGDTGFLQFFRVVSRDDMANPETLLNHKHKFIFFVALSPDPL